MSLGGSWTATAGFAAQQASLQYARSKNVLPICSSGNSAREAGYVGTETSGVGFPGRFPECVAVGSTNWSDERSNFSSWGPQVELSAPGGQSYTAAEGGPFGLIFSLSNSANNTYSYKAGTSMAAPQVAGLAGLLFATGMTSAEDVLGRMKSTAEDLGAPGRDPHFGAGRINVYRAVTQKEPAIEMTISTRSTVNLNSNGNMQVTLLDREAVTFSLDMIDVNTIKLGSTSVARRNNGSPFATWSDVDGDGKLDLVLHFSIPQLRANGDLTASTTQLTLRGTISDGRTMRGTAQIQVR
jgi:subtilisin family serine protease